MLSIDAYRTDVVLNPASRNRMGMSERKNILTALLSGVLLGLPWSVSSLCSVIFIAWVPLLHLEEKFRHHPNPSLIFNYSFASFLVWNIVGSWWIVRAQWVGAVFIIVANSLLQALVFRWASRVRNGLGIPLLFPLLILWLGYEHFHLSWDLAWPWFNLGNALVTAPRLIQWYECTGVRGGSAWILLSNLAAFKIYTTCRTRGARSIIPMGAGMLLLFLVPVFVSQHLSRNFKEEGPTVTIALVQPNLDPYGEKFDPEKQVGHVNEFFRTADAVCDDHTDFLLGPETLITRQIDEADPSASPCYRQLVEFQEKHPNLVCLLGVHSFRKASGEPPAGSRFDREGNFHYEAFNTALLLPPGSAPRFYHKTKLVPMFERMPFVQYLGFLGRYSLELGGYNGTYSRRQETSVFSLPGTSVSIVPIVCFESAFGPYCAARVPEEQGFVCMITNDGWWKNTPGYRHHYNFSPIRAIECRRDLVRVANTGISALIDARGMVTADTAWWEKTTLTGTIHLRRGRTFFSRHGDFVGRICLVLGIILLVFFELRDRMKRTGTSRR